jgi:nucleoside-diphosphate-sugar epimerase
VPKLVFISTNCLWASNLGHEVQEHETPNPVELYGRSKLAAEQVLQEYAAALQVVTIRCPTIIDSGRLGLLAILFEFIQDGKKVWVVGDGGNRYQFIYAQDLATACLQTLDYGASDLFHIGSENVVSLRRVYEAVIEAAGTKARVAQLPKGPTIAAMKLAHKLGISPLGPYHYRMIAEDFIFDTTRIRERLGWRPTVTNEQMMIEAFRYYATQRKEIHARKDVSAHSKPAEMGIIRLLKWIS